MLFDRLLIEASLRKVVSADTAHYTRIGTLCHFIPSGTATAPMGWSSAWATPVQFLNDRLELAHGLEVLQRIAKPLFGKSQRIPILIDDLSANYGTMATDAFQMSFSGNPDEIGQWRGYATNGMGCSVVTNALSVKAVADVAGWVLYDKAKQDVFAQTVLNTLRHEKQDDKIQQALVATASFMKHEGFQPEKEFRLLKFPDAADVKFRETGDRLVPFVDYLAGRSLPIRRIVIGPAWQLSNLGPTNLERNHVVQGVRRLLTARGIGNTPIEASTIPYDPR